MTFNKSVKTLLLTFVLIVNFSVFAFLNTAEGPGIAFAINLYKKSYVASSFLPVIRDLVSIIISFIIVGFLPKIGYKKLLICCLLIISVSCFTLPGINNFRAMLLLFAIIGAVFAITKICIYTLISLIFNDKKKHARILTLMEGYYNVFQVLSFLLFYFFIRINDKQAWKYIFSLYGAILIFVIVIWKFIPLQKSLWANPRQPRQGFNFSALVEISKRPKTATYLYMIALYVYVEVSLFAWLPTFNEKALNIDISHSILLASILMISIALSRFIGTVILKYLSWNFLIFSLMTAALFYLSLVLIRQNIFGANMIGRIPATAYLLPLVGLFLGPVYPVMASVTLKTVDNSEVPVLMILMQLCEGLGAIFGPIITGYTFDYYGPIYAFFMLLIPLLGVWLCLLRINVRKITEREYQVI
ncbi:MAG: MFS transporter [Lentisphaerae bacterium]|nr:MFS transporter [Lentisphaerota bacterium]MCP4102759.1 MFS transporter [Lentisphaerota bacterium]